MFNNDEYLDVFYGLSIGRLDGARALELRLASCVA